jgi:hypothetical protein
VFLVFLPLEIYLFEEKDPSSKAAREPYNFPATTAVIREYRPDFSISIDVDEKDQFIIKTSRYDSGSGSDHRPVQVRGSVDGFVSEAIHTTARKASADQFGGVATNGGCHRGPQRQPPRFLSERTAEPQPKERLDRLQEAP